MRNIIIHPIISEKSMKQAQQTKFTFAVDIKAGKRTIRQAVEAQYGVHVISAKTSVVKGRTNRTGMKRTEIQLQPWKKATVELRKGEKIDLFDVAA